MTRERLYLYDTTLRDGQQSQGVDFSAEDKRDQRGPRRPRPRLCRRRLAGRQPHRQRLLRRRPDAQATRAFRLRHDQAPRPLRLERRGPRRRSSTPARRGPASSARPTPSTSPPPSASRSRGEPRQHLRPPSASSRPRAARRSSTPSTSSTAGRPTPTTRRLRQGCADAGARWVVLCDTNGGTLPREVGAITARWSPPASPATGSASTPTTTPATPWPTRSPPSTPAPARSRARSTASASAAATPTSSA